MHTNEDYQKSIEEEEDYSNFYNTDDNVTEKKENNKFYSNRKPIIIVIILVIVLIALIVALVFIFKKRAPVDFNLSLENVTGDAWSKSDVVINVDVPNESHLKQLKYTINCGRNCEYVDVTNKKIVISNNGSSVVTVVSVNNSNIENRKNIVVKVDKNPPTLTLSPKDTNIKSTGPITVCAICTDSESGCKEDRVCKDFSKSSKDQTLTVEDKAGNTITSSKFNVTISASSENGGK